MDDERTKEGTEGQDETHITIYLSLSFSLSPIPLDMLHLYLLSESSLARTGMVNFTPLSKHHPLSLSSCRKSRMKSSFCCGVFATHVATVAPPDGRRPGRKRRAFDRRGGGLKTRSGRSTVGRRNASAWTHASSPMSDMLSRLKP